MSDNPGRVWDFTTALSAISSIHSKQWNPPTAGNDSPPSLTHSVSSSSGDDISSSESPTKSSLGNLHKVFGYLNGKGTEIKPYTVPDLSARPEKPIQLQETVDGQLSWLSQLRSGTVRIVGHNRDSKTVTWDDAAVSTSEVDAVLSENADFDLSRLSKKARKKERRRLRQLASTSVEAAGDEDVILKTPESKLAFHATSDADTDAEIKLAIQQSKTRRDVIQELLTPTKKPTKAKKPISPHDFFVHQVSKCYTSEPLAGDDSQFVSSRDAKALSKLASPQADASLNKAFEKKVELLRLLSQNFQEDAVFLSSMKPSPASAYEPLDVHPSGIHIFVDMSNILIGFHNAIKLSKGLNIHARIPRQKLSFYNFSLILERGRPVAKRCLAGSDILESVEEAMALGYENNHLDRVLKARKMTPRKQFFADRDRARRMADKSGASSAGEGHLSGLGSGIDEPVEPVAKFVEQGVDEILHLKMMESVVDHEPGTMVLATGDAAEAEFSEGFLKMCERALSRGWKVELVSFRANMSGEYRRRDWISRWSGNFRIIQLDEYVDTMRL